MTHLVYGSSLAALVAAERIAAGGEDVTWVTPTPHVGGHFAGTTIGGARCDAGLVIFEYGTLKVQESPDPLTYDPDVRNDCGRFGRILTAYTESLGITLERIPAFRMWTGESLIPDFVFDICLDGFAALPAPLAQRAADDVRRILDAGEHPLHARRKYLEPRYRDLSFDEASRANHGATLHDAFFEPFARKVTGHSSASILALYSRAAWLPLFWPETLRESLAGGTPQLANTPFHVARGGAVGDLVTALSRRVIDSPRVRRLIGPARAIRSTRTGILLDIEGTECRGESLVWGHDLDALTTLTAAGPSRDVARAPVTIVIARVPRAQVADESLGTVIIPAAHSLPYRITNQSTNAGIPDEAFVRLSVEWGGADAPADDAALLAATREALRRVGVTHDRAEFADVKIMRIPRALVLPSAGSRDALLGMRRDVDALGLPIVTVAPAAGFGVASLNDQLVQGMKAAQQALMGIDTSAVPQADGACVSNAAAA